MCRDTAVPKQKGEHETTDLQGKTLSGWEEIRDALLAVENLRRQGFVEARVEAYEYQDDISVKVTFRSVKELEQHLDSRMRRTLFEGVSDRLELERVIDPEKHCERNDVHGQLLIN